MAKKINAQLIVDDKGSATIKKFSSEADKQFKSLRNAALALAASFTAIAASTIYFGKQVYDSADKVAKLARSIGMSSIELQEYQYAASLAGVESAQLEMGLRYLIKGISDSRAGVGALTTSLKDNQGLINSLQNTRDPSKQLRIALDAISSSSDKAGLAMTLFGSRSGLALVNLAIEYEKTVEEAKKYGIAIDSYLLEGAERANDAVELLTTVIRKQFAVALLAVAPHIEEIAKKVAGWVKINQTLIDQKIEEYVKKLSEYIGVLSDNIGTVVSLLKTGFNVVLSMLVVKIGLMMAVIGKWTLSLITNIKYHIKATAAMRAFSTATVPLVARMSLVRLAAGGMWTAITGPAGIIFIVSMLALEFIGIEKIVNAIKWAFERISEIATNIGNAIAGWFGYGKGFNEQIKAQEVIIQRLKDAIAFNEKIYGIETKKNDALKEALKIEENKLEVLKAQAGISNMGGKIYDPKDRRQVAKPLPAAPPVDYSKLTRDQVEYYQHIYKITEAYRNLNWAARESGQAEYEWLIKTKDEAKAKAQAMKDLEGNVNAMWTAWAETDIKAGTEGFNDYLKVSKEKASEMGQVVRDTFVNPMADAFTDMITGAKTFSEAFGDMAKSIISDISRMIIKMLIMKALKSIFGGGFSDGGVTPQIPGAATGAVFDGPKSGYPVMMHGNEAVIPLKNGAVPVQMKGGNSGMQNNIYVTVEGGGTKAQNKETGQIIGRAVEKELDKRLAKQLKPGGMLNQAPVGVY